jgi:hypothetical protein
MGCTVGITLSPIIFAAPIINTGLAPGGDTGLFTSVVDGGLDYESNDDILSGFVDNATYTVAGITLTGYDAFDFDGDGIDLYAGLMSIAPGDNSCTAPYPGPSCYGGPDSYFVSIITNQVTFITTGTVIFDPIPPGGHTYFSLELPEVGFLCDDPTQCKVIPEPEPASVALLGSALFGFAALCRRREQSA